MSVENQLDRSEKTIHADVVIVGGGLSGLATAYKLAKLGVDFQLLEARARFGGRILTLESTRSSARFDLGPSWFWPGQEYINRLVKELDLDRLIYTQYSSGDAVFEPQGASLQRGISGISMQGSYRLQGGMIALIDALVEQISLLGFSSRLHLCSTASAITKDAEKVRVSYSPCHSGGQSEADGKVNFEIISKYLVMASPVRAILENVEINPQLGSARLAELEAVATWMAGHSKVVIEYEEPFWREAGFSGDVISQIGPMSEIHDACSNSNHSEPQAFALFGFLAIAPAVRRQQAERLPELILAQLVRIFGDRAGNPINLVIQDWAAEPLTASKHDQFIAGHHSISHWSTTVEPGWSGSLIWSGAEAAKGHINGYLEGAVIASNDTLRQLELLLGIS